MKSSYLLAGLAALVMIGSQSAGASAAQASELSRSHGSTYRQMTRSELRRERPADFYATTVRPYAYTPSPSSGNLGFIGSSEAGN